jgi:hypothetical protein
LTSLKRTGILFERGKEIMKKACLSLHYVLWGVLVSLSFACQLQAQSGGSGADASLKLHLDFDGDFSNGRVLDVTGNGHDGIQFNPTNWIVATNGIFGTTAALWTINDVIYEYELAIPVSQYIAVTNLSDIAYLTNGTVSFWAWPSATLGYYTFILDAGYPNQGGWNIQMQNIWAPFLEFISYDGSGTTITWPFGTQVVSQFHLYTMTWSGASNLVQTYFDGQLYATNTLGAPYLHVAGPTNWFSIGAFHAGKVSPAWVNGNDGNWYACFYDGRMDDLRIYNRALSPQEVQQLYYGGPVGLAIQRSGQQSITVSWNSKSNRLYQVETASTLLSNGWAALGPPIAGSGGTNWITDSLGQTNRFYRVRILP